MADNAYNSRVSRFINTDDIKKQLVLSYSEYFEKTYYRGQNNSVLEFLDKLELGSTVQHLMDRLVLVLPEHTMVDEFTYPLLIELKDTMKVAVDLRRYVTADRKNPDMIVVQDHIGLQTHIFMGILEYLYTIPAKRAIMQYRMGDTAVRVWTQWITQQMTSTRALSPIEQTKVKILAGLYWHDLFMGNDPKASDQGHREEVAIWLSTKLKMDHTEVYNTIAGVSLLNTMDLFIEALKDVSIRMKEMSSGLFLNTMSGNGWINKSTTALAVEYPPAFMAILITLSYVGNSYLFNKTQIGNVTKSLNVDIERYKQVLNALD